jgi:hypothetical protein
LGGQEVAQPHLSVLCRPCLLPVAVEAVHCYDTAGSVSGMDASGMMGMGMTDSRRGGVAPIPTPRGGSKRKRPLLSVCALPSRRSRRLDFQNLKFSMARRCYFNLLCIAWCRDSELSEERPTARPAVASAIAAFSHTPRPSTCTGQAGAPIVEWCVDIPSHAEFPC